MKVAVMMGLVLVLLGCGVPADITYHYNTSPEELAILAGYQTFGYSKREWKVSQWDCDIWIADAEDTPSQSCWLAVLEHEKRHCYEGDFPHNPLPECTSTGNN